MIFFLVSFLYMIAVALGCGFVIMSAAAFFLTNSAPLQALTALAYPLLRVAPLLRKQPRPALKDALIYYALCFLFDLALGRAGFLSLSSGQPSSDQSGGLLSSIGYVYLIAAVCFNLVSLVTILVVVLYRKSKAEQTR